MVIVWKTAAEDAVRHLSQATRSAPMPTSAIAAATQDGDPPTHLSGATADERALPPLPKPSPEEEMDMSWSRKRPRPEDSSDDEADTQ
ncbi:hypothetical protein MRX96_004109 [Rhipicephalus microplus]